MYKVEFKTGKNAGKTKEYKFATKAAYAVYRNMWVIDMELTEKIREWIMSMEHSNKPHNLTVVDTIRIEYTPN